jgi:hypothetical protein
MVALGGFAWLDRARLIGERLLTTLSRYAPFESSHAEMEKPDERGFSRYADCLGVIEPCLFPNVHR